MSREFKVTAHMWGILPEDHPAHGDQRPGGFWGCRRGLPGVGGWGGVATTEGCELKRFYRPPPHPTAASVGESLQPTKPLGDL